MIERYEYLEELKKWKDKDLTFCSKKSLTSKVGDELRLLMLEEY